MKVVPRKRGVKFSRANVYERDHGKCQYCATHISPRVATFDHVLPRSQGGLTSWENVVIACNDCNQKKGGRTPEQARMKLLSKPGRPKKLSGTAIDIEYRPGMPEAWKNYMRSTLYWNIELENSNKKED